MGSVTRAEHLPAARAERERGLLLLGALRLMQRDQLARDEREGDEDRRQHDAGHGEDDLDVVRLRATARASPGAPNSSTKIRPEITGETRERQVDQRDAAASCRGSRTSRSPTPRRRRTRRSAAPRSAATSSVSRIAASASGSAIAAQVGAPALRRAPARTRRRAAAPGTAPRKASATADQEPAARRGARASARARARRGCTTVPHARRADARAPRLQRVDANSSANDATSMHQRDRGGAGVVVLLELGDDQQRRDLGLHRHVAGDEDDRAVLAERAREGEREAGEQRGRTARAGSRGGTSAQRLAPRLAAASSTSGSSPASTGCTRAHHERQADEGQRDDDAERA